MWTSERRGRLPAVACLVTVVLLAAPGCVEHALRAGTMPMDYAPYHLPELATPTEGAVWADGARSGSFLFFDHKARGVGDLVTVLIVEDMEAVGKASTALDSSRALDASITSDVGLQTLIGTPIRKLLGLLGLGNTGSDVAPGTEVEVIASSTENSFDGEGTTERSGSFTGVMTCRVVDVTPGGLLHIRGHRYVIVNHDAQFITLEGLVRREDIGIDNTVPSTALAEAQITYDGLGVLDDKQRPGLLARVFDWIYPF